MVRKKHVNEVTFTVPELARRWRVHRHTVSALIKKGALQAFKAGERQYRILETEVIKYEQAQAVRSAS